MTNSNFIFLYRPDKANYFLQNGAELVEIGRGNSGNVYFKFVKSEVSLELTNKWKSMHININEQGEMN